MLEYTGHPIVDVGIATIVAFAGRNEPSELVEADLEKIADFITKQLPPSPPRSRTLGRNVFDVPVTDQGDEDGALFR